MKGSKPRANLAIVASGLGKQILPAPPAWLPGDAKSEWRRVVADLSRRGLLFDGAMASLEAYCLCVAQIRQCQKVLAAEPAATADGIHPAFHAQQKAIQSARLLAVELGLSVVSRLRSFTGKSSDEQEWRDLEVG